MECLPGLSQDTNHLRSFRGNRAKMLLKSHLGIICHSQYIKIIRLLRHSIVNAGDYGCIVPDMGTIIVLVLPAFNFIPQRSHHSLSMTRALLKDYATVTLTPGNAKQPSKWSHRHNPSAYSSEWKKTLRHTGGTITGPENFPAALLTRR